MHSAAGRLAGRQVREHFWCASVCLSSCSSPEEEEDGDDDATCTWFVHDGRLPADREGKKRMTAATTADCN